MKTLERRQRHRQALRAEILGSAQRLLAREGYDRFTMRKLAAKIGCSPGAIYLHFENQEQLFHCLMEESFARLLEALEVVRERHDQDPVALLRQGLRVYVDFGLRHPNDYRTAFLLPPPDPKRPYRPHGAFDVLREIVARCIERGRFRDADVETTSQALWASVHGITSLLIQRPTFPWAAKDQLIAQVIDNAVDGLLAPGRTEDT